MKVHSLFWVRLFEHDTNAFALPPQLAFLVCAHCLHTICNFCIYQIYSAPTDDAFAELPDGIVNQLLQPENVEILKNVLLLHVIDGEIDSSMVSSGFVTTLSGIDIEAVVSDSGISFNDSSVIQADVVADNGIIHVIDGVLLPPVS